MLPSIQYKYAGTVVEEARNKMKSSSRTSEKVTRLLDGSRGCKTGRHATILLSKRNRANAFSKICLPRFDGSPALACDGKGYRDRELLARAKGRGVGSYPDQPRCAPRVLWTCSTFTMQPHPPVLLICLLYGGHGAVDQCPLFYPFE